KTGEPVKRNIVSEVTQGHFDDDAGKRAYIVFPFQFNSVSKIEDRKLSLGSLMERGFTKAFLEGEVSLGKEAKAYDIQGELENKASPLWGKPNRPINLLVMTDRVVFEEDMRGRFEDALVQAYGEGFGRARIVVV